MYKDELGLFDDELLTRPEVAKLLRVSVSTVERMALNGSGPPYSRIGGTKRGRVVYRRGDVEAYLLSCRRTSTSDAGPAR
jgi:predicted DNA-binding transcriptional regulator AlpA